mmetsp:Transcript_37146/g.57060  ORF Transcript_37146/g.57060 Transcript_37146/m.57060 type:complete len:198 (+) Transcript_37146:51-644(+)
MRLVTESVKRLGRFSWLASRSFKNDRATFRCVRRMLTVDDAMNSDSSRPRRDPTALRPNKVCDPYGQGGKPLPNKDAKAMLTTLDEGWILEYATDNEDEPPTALYKEFFHSGYLQGGARFLTIVASVGTIHNHFPFVSLERRLGKKRASWEVVTKVRCSTPTLQGLSSNDFHIALMIDVEASRAQNAKLFAEARNDD